MNEQVKDIWQYWWQNHERINDFWQGWLEKQNKDLWQKFWPDQEKVFEYWKQAMSPLQSGNIFEIPGMKDLFLMENFKGIYQDWLKTMTEGFSNYLKWMPAGVGKDTFEKMMQSVDLFMKPLALFSSLTDKLPLKDDTEKWKDLFQTWAQNYMKALEGAFPGSLPDPVKSLLKNPVEIAGLNQQILYKFFQPWLELSPEIKDNFLRFCRGDQAALAEFLRVWHQAYYESYGKLFQIPAFGSGKDTFEKLSGSIDAYMQYLAAISEMWGTLYKISSEATESLMNKISKLSGDEAPKTFKELYQMWWQTNEDAFFDLFKTDSFAKILGKTVDAGVVFKKNFDEMLLEYVSQLPVPTNRDMDSVYKTIHELKTTIKEQTKKLEELSNVLKQVNIKEGTVAS
ncbi:MAG: Poly(R)-hydroxyalkanoic acid synthase subunit (PHA_synth_III_E) [Pelotomaculum sp. PtaB.Bin104]|nr:MAG: Poly(R)-hydroxyalkanoic acid synthase subunit (PHA_synth_III_E) [Pelotomaculum sp. PtaB.Bin104]